MSLASPPSPASPPAPQRVGPSPPLSAAVPSTSSSATSRRPPPPSKPTRSNEMPRRDPRTPEGATMSLSNMWTIRRFEEAVEELFSRGLLHGTMHLSIGQESVAEGVCAALEFFYFCSAAH